MLRDSALAYVTDLTAWQLRGGGAEDLAKLTESSLRKAPEQPRQLLLDDSGLRARHGVRGFSFFFRQYHQGGKYSTVTLGRYPELSLRDARMAMAEKVVELKDAPPKGSAVDEAAEGYLERYADRDAHGEAVLDEDGQVRLTARAGSCVVDAHSREQWAPSEPVRVRR